MARRREMGWMGESMRREDEKGVGERVRDRCVGGVGW